MIYRIGAEFRPGLSDVVAKYFDCFTIIEGIGYWKGVAERSATIEIACPVSPENEQKVHDLAGDIRFTYDQEAVLIQKIPANSRLLYADHLEVL